MLARLAPLAGWIARLTTHFGVGVAGATCVVIGAALVYPPAAWVAAGGFLLALDRKVP